MLMKLRTDQKPIFLDITSVLTKKLRSMEMKILEIGSDLKSGKYNFSDNFLVSFRCLSSFIDLPFFSLKASPVWQPDLSGIFSFLQTGNY